MGKHRGRDEWRRLVEEWEVSGESAREFARRVGVSRATLYRQQRLRASAGRKPPEAALAKFVEVRAARQPSDDRFEVRLIDGRCVGVPPSFDGEALGRLLRVLEAS
jgi:hypothetical protein